MHEVVESRIQFFTPNALGHAASLRKVVIHSQNSKRTVAAMAKISVQGCIDTPPSLPFVEEALAALLVLVVIAAGLLAELLGFAVLVVLW